MRYKRLFGICLELHCLSILTSFSWKSFLDQHKKLHGKFGKVKRFPDVPSDRIYGSTLSQWPRKAVSSTLYKTSNYFLQANIKNTELTHYSPV